MHSYFRRSSAVSLLARLPTIECPADHLFDDSRTPVYHGFVSGSAGSTKRRHSLPLAVTPILGREGALEETGRLLRGTRLLTITGAGGSGKTRLAMELAQRVAGRFERAVWIDLSGIADGTLVASEIVHAFGRRESPIAADEELLVEVLRDSRVLLLLDNVEHVVDAGAAIVSKILRSCGGTTIVVTTREALGVEGEQIWLVPPLAEDDAVELFVQRARAVDPSFHSETKRDTIAQICRRLDGIPLAIELAAVRAKVLPVEQIAARLDDAFNLLAVRSRAVARHRTIRETIDWSYRLLPPEEQWLLAVLSVFAGGFALASVSEVCETEDDVLSPLSALVDKSLVVAGGGRYRLLETVRQFAAEKLAASGQREVVRQKHAETYFRLVERSERRIFAGAVDLAVQSMLDEKIENIRQALDWAAEDPSRFEIEARFLWAIHWYWFARGHFHEARRRITSAVSRMPGGVDPLVRARLYVAAGNAAVWQGDWKALRPSIDEAVAILGPTNNLRALANGLLLLGSAHALAENDTRSAREVFELAEDVARRNGRNVALALVLYWAGIAASLRGDAAAARRAFAEAHQIGLEQRNLPAIGHGATMLALVHLQEKEYEPAIRYLRAALDAHSETGDAWGLTQAIEGVGLLLLDTGDAEIGTRLIAAASAAWLAIGARPGRTEALEEEKTLRIRQALGDDRLRVALASGAAMPYEEMVALAREQIGTISKASTPVAPALTVRALGALEIFAGGSPIDATAQRGRATELLLFLLFNPAGATKEEIGVALWPEADPSKLRNNFHVTVHRLRKLLGGPHWIAADKDVYTLNRSGGVDFDAELFEREVKGALRTGELARIEAALTRYRGDLARIPGSGEWLLAFREQLRELYSDALRTAGRGRMSAGDFAGAAQFYEKLIDADDLDEQAYRNLMICLGRTGDLAGTSRVYRRLARILRRELDTDPDPATTRLHERIVGQLDDPLAAE
jgi:predicted ATPase/DNA-binding SARP family transcriptional activator